MKEEEKPVSYIRVRPVDGEIDITFSFPPASSISEDSSSPSFKRFRNFKRPSNEPLAVSLKKIAASIARNENDNKKEFKKKNKHFQSGVGPFGGVQISDVRVTDDFAATHLNASLTAPSTSTTSSTPPTSESLSDSTTPQTPAPSTPTPPPLPHVALWSGDALITNDAVLNLDGFKTGGRLQVDDYFYKVLYDPPTVKSLKLHKSSIVAGCPYVPQVELIESSVCPVSTCRLEWYRSTNIPKIDPSESHSKKFKPERLAQGWEKVGEEYHYVPSDDDVGRLLKVRCFPVVDDLDHFMELISPVPVSALPLAEGETFPFEKRQKLTSDFSSESEFRIMSYNLLADYYSDSDFSRTSLFPYCPTQWLSGEYRRQVLLREIPGYRPDIVMMQEVDRKMFRNGLKSVLGAEGMSGSLALKKEVPEGLATFWRNSRFRFLDSTEFEFNDLLTANDSELEDISKIIEALPQLKEKMNVLKTVYLLVVLEDASCPDRILVVANTHLYYHPPAAHIRLIQMEVLLRKLKKIVGDRKEEGRNVSVVLGGDFNSVPERGLYEYLTKGKIAKTYNDWYSCGIAEYPGMDLSHDFSLFSAAGTPPYTNFVAGFCGTLDYIYADESKLEVKREIPLPDQEDVVKEIALPNRIFPSDHLPLVVELKWKS